MNVKELIFAKDGTFSVRHRPMTEEEVALAEKAKEMEVNEDGV